MSQDKQDFRADYIDVATRIGQFREQHPHGSLRPADPTQPYRIETIDEQTWIVVVAAAYRSPEDQLPGIGMAYERYPGRTPYTRGSELQNAETSAWGRAIVASLAADTKHGTVASQEEVDSSDAAELDALKREIWEQTKRLGWPDEGRRDRLADDFARRHDGADIAQATESQLQGYLETLRQGPTTTMQRGGSA